jgi:hypothetical protein
MDAKGGKSVHDDVRLDGVACREFVDAVGLSHGSQGGQGWLLLAWA